MHTTDKLNKQPAVLGVALGDPGSPMTYSGVPFHLFAELRRLGCLVGVADSLVERPIDVFTGIVDFHRSLLALRPKRNSLWRYSKKGMEALSKRFQQIQKKMPSHDVVLQIGVGAMPSDKVKLAVHIEISVATAINTETYAKSYGFFDHGAHKVAEAIEGERRFLERCSMVWTNSNWTAEGLREQGVDERRIKIYPPAAGIKDPGTVGRDWSKCNILFVGSKWQSKGGELLIEAFTKIRKANPEATLSVVGCKPSINMPGVKVYGYLRKDRPDELVLLNSIYRNTTIFCMPSYWETTGMVYMEAALWGLPVVMLRGQDRERIFPESMAVHVDRANASEIAEVLIELCRSPETMARMGMCGRELVLKKYTWPKVAQKIYEGIKELI